MRAALSQQRDVGILRPTPGRRDLDAVVFRRMVPGVSVRTTFIVGFPGETDQEFEDFNLKLEVRTQEKSNSGIYLRGSPQVQIWDPYTQPTKHGSEVGSGAFYNNKTNASKPLMVADKPIGEWNTMEVTGVGKVLTLWVNGAVTCQFEDCGREKGCLGLEGEGYRIEFRNLKLKVLR